MSLIEDLEKLAVWPSNKEGLESVVDSLATLYMALEKAAPEGFIERTTSQAESLEALGNVGRRWAEEEINEAVNFLGRLGGSDEHRPNIRSGESWEYNRARSTVTFGNRADNIAIPDLAKLMHETGHWAYDNILTTSDRLEFWEAMSKYYRENGSFDPEGVSSRTAIDGIPGVDTKALEGPQEFFAIQLSQWAMQGTSAGVFRNETFWQKKAGNVQAVFKRNFQKD